MILVSIAEQKLSFFDNNGNENRSYSISTALNGVGEQEGSYKTPRGRHYISEMYGHSAPINSVFVARRLTGEICSPELMLEFPERDWILTRIMRLSGLEDGINMGGNVDTFNRYIYIHGCPDSCQMGVPLSHGCVRMRNSDVVELFDLVNIGCVVDIS